MKKFDSSMRPRVSRLSSLRGFSCVLGLALGAGLTLPLTFEQAHAQPRQLEIWPGQRVLLVLPATIGPDWNADATLGEAILPLVQRPLRDALSQTRKFSLTTPYRFDPILRRAVVDKRISDEDVTSLLSNPSIETAQPILSKLTFDQAPMFLETRVEELRTGGTAKAPTVQLKVSSRLFESSGGAPFRNITVTSPSVGGSTPVLRVQNAARAVFAEIATALVAAPESFTLPASAVPAPANGNGASKAPANGSGATPSVGGAVPAIQPAAPTPVTPLAPTPLSPPAGAPFVPQLPAAQPPLGIAVNETPGTTR